MIRSGECLAVVRNRKLDGSRWKARNLSGSSLTGNLVSGLNVTFGLF